MWYKENREKICKIEKKLIGWFNKYFEDLDGEEWYWCKGEPEASRISGFGVEKTFGDPFPDWHDTKGVWISPPEYRTLNGSVRGFDEAPLFYFRCPIPEEISHEIRQGRGQIRPNHRLRDLKLNDSRLTFFRGCYE